MTHEEMVPEIRELLIKKMAQSPISSIAPGKINNLFRYTIFTVVVPYATSKSLTTRNNSKELHSLYELCVKTFIYEEILLEILLRSSS